jgi:hypothetical protein
MRLALIFGGEHGGRHQRRRKFYRFHHAVARQIAVDIFQFERARRQKHAALTAVAGLVDQPRRLIVIKDAERAAPVALGAAEPKHRMRCPGRRRRYLQRFFRDHDRGDRIVGALRLDEQPAQAEQPGVLALGHGAEGALRGLAVAVELRRLRVQQQRQRIVPGMPPRGIGVLAGGCRIAMADREQSLGDGMPAARMAAFAPAAADPIRRAPQC